MENQTNHYNEIEIWVSTFQPELKDFFKHPEARPKKEFIREKNVYLYSTERLVSVVDRIRTLTARYGSRSLVY